MLDNEIRLIGFPNSGGVRIQIRDFLMGGIISDERAYHVTQWLETLSPADEEALVIALQIKQESSHER